MKYPNAIWSPTQNFKRGRKEDVSLIVLHITDGQKDLKRAIEHLSKPKNQVSAHFLIGQDGTVVQLVDTEDTAWHASGVNNKSIGIEHCARSPKEFSDEDPGLPMTDEQYQSSALLVNWLCELYNLPKDRNHILGHSELIDEDGKPLSSHRDCPQGDLS